MKVEILICSKKPTVNDVLNNKENSLIIGKNDGSITLYENGKLISIIEPKTT